MKFAIIGLFLSLGMNAAEAADLPQDLQYHLAAHNAFSYQTLLRVSGEVKTSSDPKPDVVSADIAMRQRLIVTGSDAKSGNYTIEHYLYNLRLTEGGKITDALTAPKITTVIDPQGKLVDVQGLDKLANANEMPALDPTTFSSLLYSFPTYPRTSVKAGDSWSDEIPVQLPTGQKMAAKRKMTLLSLGDVKEGEKTFHAARIKTETTLNIDAKVAGAEGGTLTGSQTGTGESQVSLEDGMPLESKTDLKMEVVAKPTTPPVDQNGKPMDGSVHVTTSLHLESKRVPDETPPAPKDAQSKGNPPKDDQK